MGSEYRAEKDILASELFDGRLQKLGVREHGQARKNHRCLTDGENCLGVRINDAGYVAGFEREWNGNWGSPEKILSAVSDAFETKIFSYREPEYYGLKSEEEKAAWRSEQDEYLGIRKAEGLKIDPDTAEVSWEYAPLADVYGVYPYLPDEIDCIGRVYFARRPGSDIWVEFQDIPDKTCDALHERIELAERQQGWEDLPF